MRKYIGMDVHLATTVVAVEDTEGRLLMETILATQGASIVAFLESLSGPLWVTFEEGSQAHWLYGLVEPHVERAVVCDPRKNVSLKKGNKNDRVDARKLAELLRAGLLTPVYHRLSGGGELKEAGRSYLTLTQDTTRAMNRLKALYRGRGIASRGQRVYSPRDRAGWLEQLPDGATRRRAERLYDQLDTGQALRHEAKRDLLAQARRHPAHPWLRSIPRLGLLRAALLIALVQTPHRFRTKRQLWAYAGLALVTRTSAEYRMVNGQVVRSTKPVALRGLNPNHHHELKNLFKSAATTASRLPGPWQAFYQRRLDQGMKPELARLTLARKIAAVALHLWKKGETYDADFQLKAQAA